jgi:diaminohydroxyphosphoribosylaminopyrimidine deaminase/5-amino-6-(5-phosphoribosylamino)uracil reductase
MHVQAYYDELFMRQALSLATKGWGETGINPLVGAVITKNNKIVGRGFHRKLGEAHAEVCALIEAGRRAENATLYVNLEPCCTTGLTPPCVRAIAQAHVRRVVVGTIDPNPDVNGKGIGCLKQHNIEITIGVLAEAAQELNKWYTKFITSRIPYVILKIAASSNHRISGFKDRYITSQQSRRFVHALRSRVNAVLVGIRTILADNCYLTDRLVGRHSPARIVIDPHLRLPLDSHFMEPNSRRIVVTNSTNDVGKIEKLIARGAEIIILEGDHYAIDDIVGKLRILRINSIMVEGGARVFSDFYRNRRYDEIYLFVAPHTVSDGVVLDDHIWQEAIAQEHSAVTIGDDRLYHVYRNN